MSQLRDLFELARDLPAVEREAALLARTTDAKLIREVLALLDAASATQTRGRTSVQCLARAIQQYRVARRRHAWPLASAA